MAEAFDQATGRRKYRTFPTERAAINWRQDMQVAIRRGEIRAVAPVTIAEAYERWTKKAHAGEVRARGGAIYKPSVLHSYDLAFTGRLLKRFGCVKVGELRRADVQRTVDAWIGEGLAPQTVRNLVNALRVLLKWCVRDELIQVNPCDGLQLPSGGKTRDRIAPPAEAIELIAALADVQDRALMATAFFSGLRRGELMALKWDCVDLVGRTITVHHERGNFDTKTRQYVTPKSKKGARTLGIPKLLVPYLAALNGIEGLVFPSPKGVPFADSAVGQRAGRLWKAAKLTPIGLHEARHTYASLMIAAGVNIKTISEWMGHSSVNITLDRYGHLLPGSAKVALGLLDGYLEGELVA